jgi:hypothetical protein
MKTLASLGVPVLAALAPLRGASRYPLKLDDAKAVYLTPDRFPIRGDGRSDDSAAIQHAIDRVQETTGQGIVFIPSDRYRISRTLFVWPGIRLIGYGATRPAFVLADDAPGFQTGPAYMVFFAGFRPGSLPARFRESLMSRYRWISKKGPVLHAYFGAVGKKPPHRKPSWIDCRTRGSHHRFPQHVPDSPAPHSDNLPVEPDDIQRIGPPTYAMGVTFRSPMKTRKANFAERFCQVEKRMVIEERSSIGLRIRRCMIDMLKPIASPFRGAGSGIRQIVLRSGVIPPVIETALASTDGQVSG